MTIFWSLVAVIVIAVVLAVVLRSIANSCMGKEANQ